ncbi:MAG TPA: FUSC family protein [Dyella sp.]|uniref:FUSC family protein n=1 Tax=Dyella sp. TaxID=1869338 RepID=UPI002D774376|nr:FUSC family protein [Dyella sp.]HET6553024.1 FUSC family protein [Dyella sp.]
MAAPILSRMSTAAPWIRIARSRAFALWQPLVEAVATMMAAVATLLCTQAFAPGRDPAVLAVVLCLSLSRSQLDRDLRGRLEAAVVLPAVGFVAIGVGLLLRHLPWMGALVFVGGLFLSIWLRRFGQAARRAGSLMALPFVVLLTVPHGRADSSALLPAWLVPMLVAWLALGWVSVFHLLLRRLRLQPARMPEVTTVPALPVADGRQRMPASTRMAVQMAVALAVAFVAGYVFFPERWAWIVLTAFIVNSGNRGRLDVAYKSGLRVLGAAAGTVLAMSLSLHLTDDPTITGMLILLALFFGAWLRPLGYGWWALFVTLALALLQGFGDATPTAMLWQRLEEIAIGAVIGLASAWFVLPVRSTDVLRRRLADALAALSEAIDPATPVRTPARVVASMAQLEQMIAPFHASRWATRRFRAVHPADWADTLLACHAPAIELIMRGETPGRVRQAVGQARRALREPAALLPALQHLRSMLEG